LEGARGEPFFKKVSPKKPAHVKRGEKALLLHFFFGSYRRKEKVRGLRPLSKRNARTKGEPFSTPHVENGNICSRGLCPLPRKLLKKFDQNFL
jgi:hypothetical protein